ncbi:MAG: hypothetical protein ACUZ8I_10400 [Candidatus Scalindua sp.]
MDKNEKSLIEHLNEYFTPQITEGIFPSQTNRQYVTIVPRNVAGGCLIGIGENRSEAYCNAIRDADTEGWNVTFLDYSPLHGDTEGTFGNGALYFVKIYFNKVPLKAVVAELVDKFRKKGIE